MSATIIVESGSGNDPTANSYLALADVETYMLTILDHANWDALSTDDKTRYVISTCRLLDAAMEFNGFIANILQPMQWPRVLARNPNQYGGAYYRRPDTYLAQYWDSTTIPQKLKDAVCEMIRFLVDGNAQNDDRTADAPGKGIDTFEIYQGVKVKFSKADQRPIIPDSVQFLLSQFGQPRSSRGGNARVVRT